MKEERNPFSVAIPILFAIAGVIVFYRLFAGMNSRGNLNRRPPPHPFVIQSLGISPATPGKVLAPPKVGLSNVSVPVRADDAAVVWLGWTDPNSRLAIGAVSDERGRHIEYSVRQLGASRAALILAKGYGLVKSIKVAGTLSGATQPAIGSCVLRVDDLPEEKRIIAANQPPDNFVRLRREAFDPNWFDAVIKPRDPKTQAVAVRVEAATFSENGEPFWMPMFPLQIETKPAYWTASNKQFHGRVYVRNGGMADGVRIEIVELVAPRVSGYVEFKSANLLAVNAHRSIIFSMPEVQPGPGNSMLGLVAFAASHPPAKLDLKDSGWFNATIEERTKPTAIEHEWDVNHIVRAQIVWPPAIGLGIAPSNYLIKINDRGPARDLPSCAGLPADPPLPRFSKGSLGIRVVVQRPQLLSRRTITIPVDAP